LLPSVCAAQVTRHARRAPRCDAADLLGHEAAGIIEEVLVVPTFIPACANCHRRAIPPLELLVTQKPIMLAVYGFASPAPQPSEVKLWELVTHTYRLAEINRGYADLEANKNLRAVVVFD
jgi:Zn-dependent alcohol dehydrogenase